jgi:hypothetical protein
VRAEAEERQRAWLAASAGHRRDPGLLLHYSFQAEQTWTRTLPDQAAGGRHPGAVVGCSWGTGRWPGKQALEFKRVGDRVRFHVAHEFREALALAAWVRVDALPNRFNSLMMTDGWEEASPHWHISAAGRVELGVQGPDRQNGAHYLTPEVFTPERLGQWSHLAVVYDRNRGEVAHYVNGRQVAREPVAHDLPLRLGNVELGNWNVAAYRGKSVVRCFSGCIDEFMIFSRALDGREVGRLYAGGRPPS